MRSSARTRGWLAVLSAGAVAVAVALALPRARSPREPSAPPASSAAPADDGVDARLDAFWDWWRSGGPRVAAALDARREDDVVAQLSDRVHAIDAHLAWETGPGLKGARYQLVLSSEGDLARRVLLERWLARAPAPDATWEFYPARQASPRASWDSLVLRPEHDTPDVAIGFAEVRVALEVDPARALVDVTLHHPALARLDEDGRMRAAFLVLDNVLGEDGVERWLGALTPSVRPLRGGRPLAALADAVAALERAGGEERFAMLEGRTPSGRPLLALVNVSVKRLDHLLLDRHVEVTLPLREQGEEGMPSSAENEALNALEDELLAALGADAVYLGHETGDGRRTIHLHASGRGPVEARTRDWAARHPDRRIAIEVRDDPSWQVLGKWR